MYQLLLRLIIVSALIQLGISISDLFNCDSSQCRKRMTKAYDEVLHIDWKPISAFPEEASRFNRK